MTRNERTLLNRLRLHDSIHATNKRHLLLIQRDLVARNARLVALVHKLGSVESIYRGCHACGKSLIHAPDCPVAAEIAALCGEE